MNILFDDRYLTVFEKEPGTDSEKITYSDVFGEEGGTFFCVHRLDKEVGGATVYAKDKETAASLTRMIQEHRFSKKYLALAEGIPEQPSGVFTDLLFHDRRTNKTFIAKSERKGVKRASLSYETLLSKDGLSLILVTLHTGRTHQIRIQFASRKLPLAGDARYGSRTHAPHIMLWSSSLSFTHPVTGEELTFSSVPAGDMWSQWTNNIV